MTHDEIMNFDPTEAFEHGKQVAIDGYSIHYNPYINYKDKKQLSLSWENGWKSAQYNQITKA